MGKCLEMIPSLSNGVLESLTNRESEVLALIVVGMTNAEIARELDISSRTVEVHRSRITQKLGARNTADVVRIALIGE